MLTGVKVGIYNVDKLESEIFDISEKACSESQLRLLESKRRYQVENYLQSWFAPEALKTLLAYRDLIGKYENQDVLKIILSRAARSSRRARHFDLEFPKKPQLEPYHCYKHSRTCKPTESSYQFIKRYSSDTIKRIREFSGIRKNVHINVINGDIRTVDFPDHDMVITSPPYVGLIDYHGQHRYAYELLGLKWNADDEIGPAVKGNSQRAQRLYVDNMVESFLNVKKGLARGGRMVVVVNDKLDLYGEIAERTGFKIEAHLQRHVNRRTGRRAGDFFESVFVWKTMEN